MQSERLKKYNIAINFFWKFLKKYLTNPPKDYEGWNTCVTEMRETVHRQDDVELFAAELFAVALNELRRQEEESSNDKNSM